MLSLKEDPETVLCVFCKKKPPKEYFLIKGPLSVLSITNMCPDCIEKINFDFDL